jgi:hypothetical protein
MSLAKDYNKEVQEINNNLSLIKRGGASYKKILDQILTVRNKFTNMLSDIRMKRENLSNFEDEKRKKIEKVSLILKDQDKKIKEFEETIEKYTNISKTVIAAINFKNLKKVKREDSVEDLFKFFYVTLYREQENTFLYNEFMKIALGSQILDFQSRLAKFSIAKLDKDHREQIKAIKNNNYPDNNDDLNSMLEWIDYNFEAYLALKQKEDLEQKKQRFLESNKKYQKSIESSKYISDEQQSIINFLTDYIESLNYYEKKINESSFHYQNNRLLIQEEGNLKNLFQQIDRFEGNELAEELDNLNH